MILCICGHRPDLHGSRCTVTGCDCEMYLRQPPGRILEETKLKAGDRRMCPACFKDNGAFILGCRESPLRCAFCGVRLQPASKVLGDDYKAILAQMRRDVGTLSRAEIAGCET